MRGLLVDPQGRAVCLIPAPVTMALEVLVGDRREACLLTRAHESVSHGVWASACEIPPGAQIALKPWRAPRIELGAAPAFDARPAMARRPMAIRLQPTFAVGDRISVIDAPVSPDWTWDGTPCGGVVVEVREDDLDVELPNGDIEPFGVDWLLGCPFEGWVTNHPGFSDGW